MFSPVESLARISRYEDVFNQRLIADLLIEKILANPGLLAWVCGMPASGKTSFWVEMLNAVTYSMLSKLTLEELDELLHRPLAEFLTTNEENKVIYFSPLKFDDLQQAERERSGIPIEDWSQRQRRNVVVTFSQMLYFILEELSRARDNPEISTKQNNEVFYRFFYIFFAEFPAMPLHSDIPEGKELDFPLKVWSQLTQERKLTDRGASVLRELPKILDNHPELLPLLWLLFIIGDLETRKRGIKVRNISQVFKKKYEELLTFFEKKKKDFPNEAQVLEQEKLLAIEVLKTEFIQEMSNFNIYFLGNPNLLSMINHFVYAASEQGIQRVEEEVNIDIFRMKKSNLSSYILAEDEVKRILMPPQRKQMGQTAKKYEQSSKDSQEYIKKMLVYIRATMLELGLPESMVSIAVNFFDPDIPHYVRIEE
jgi:hypothetical protein